jgi:hypothetical protein
LLLPGRLLLFRLDDLSWLHLPAVNQDGHPLRAAIFGIDVTRIRFAVVFMAIQ